jgi:hypothetical protein
VSATVLVQIERVKGGENIDAELEVSYDADGGTLVVRSDWSSRLGRWRRERVYRLTAVPSSVGRSFVLSRSPAPAGQDGEYMVTTDATGRYAFCSCPGWQGCGYCRHYDALRGLIEAGLIDEPAGQVEPADGEEW